MLDLLWITEIIENIDRRVNSEISESLATIGVTEVPEVFGGMVCQAGLEGIVEMRVAMDLGEVVEMGCVEDMEVTGDKMEIWVREITESSGLENKETSESREIIEILENL